jgi:hypothetical protein
LVTVPEESALSRQAARRRLSAPIPYGIPLTPKDTLLHCGLEFNVVTAKLFRYVDHEHEQRPTVTTPGINMSTTRLAIKYLESISGGKLQCFRHLNQDNRVGSFDRASLRYFPRRENRRTGNDNPKEEEEILKQIESDIVVWLSSQEVPEGHVRFFPGTDSPYRQPRYSLHRTNGC